MRKCGEYSFSELKRRNENGTEALIPDLTLLRFAGGAGFVPVKHQTI
jgi:hypothetical protein